MLQLLLLPAAQNGFFKNTFLLCTATSVVDPVPDLRLPKIFFVNFFVQNIFRDAKKYMYVKRFEKSDPEH
jgi:hypothetical protein